MEEESYLYINSHSRSASPEPQCQDTPNVYLKQFIDTYKSLPSLWDRTNQNYLNKRKRHEDLDKLAKILRYLKPYATREDARKKVNSLRSNFRKELVKIERSKRSGAEKIYKPTSATFHMLKFLAKCENSVLSLGESDDDDEKPDNSAMLSPFKTEEPSPKIRRMLKKSRIARRNALLTKTCLVPQPVEPIPTAVEPIALVWSQKIKNLSVAQRLHAEKAINDILYEAELQNLNESVERAPSPPMAVFISSPSADNSKPDLVVDKEESLEG